MRIPVHRHTGELTFGESFNAVATGKTHFWIAVLQDGAAASSLPSLLRRTPFAYLIAPFMMPRGAVENQRKHRAYSVDVVRRRLNRPSAPPTDQEKKNNSHQDEEKGHGHGHGADHDIFAGLLSDPTVPEDVLVSQAYTLVIAGADTVSATMTAALHFLCTTSPTPSSSSSSSSCMEILQAEVRALPYSELTDAVLSHLPYLNAVIEETLRLFPPVAFGLPRVVPPAAPEDEDEDEGGGGANMTMMMIDGHAIPTGTEVSVAQWVMNRRADVWGSRSAEFVPERWLRGVGDDDDGEKKGKEKPVTFPFSTGPRACIGITQAYLEMRVVLAKLVHVYDLELEHEHEHEHEGTHDSRSKHGGGDWLQRSRMHFMWKKAPLRVRFVPRKTTS